MKKRTTDRHYTIHRDADGMTPRQRLDTARARLVELQELREREHWQTRAEAEQAAQETANIIQSDIFGTLPLELSGKLSGRIFTPAEVRLVVRASVDTMVRGWVAGERVLESAITKTETRTT